MNTKLNNDWKRGIGFFEKSILYCEMEYPADIHTHVMGIIWQYLDSKITDNEDLYFLEDWHGHDGFISAEKKISKIELASILLEPEKIFRTRDTYVYDLVYSAKEHFMLRWYCENEPDDEIWCDFSLILSDNKELELLKENIQKKALQEGLCISSAKKYFDSRYGG